MKVYTKTNSISHKIILSANIHKTKGESLCSRLCNIIYLEIYSLVAPAPSPKSNTIEKRSVLDNGFWLTPEPVGAR